MNTLDNTDFLLSSYTYSLPEAQIALYPAQERGGSRLLVLDRKTGKCTESSFASLLDFFQKPVLFVVNDSKVLPARMCGKRASGAILEFLLLSPVPLLEIETTDVSHTTQAVGLLKGGKRCKVGELLYFGELVIKIIERMDFGKCRVELSWRIGKDLETIFQEQGHIPLPPYIKREDTGFDVQRYQTIFADETKCGSVASPTASLHCSDTFLQQVEECGSSIASVTLYVGYGTFSPIRTEDIRKHTMHEEYIEITQENAFRIQHAKENNIPIVAIGTTSMRVLESVASTYGRIQACSMMTDIYITPEYDFKCVNHLVTNFHLPESSLLVLVSAFASRKSIISAYQQAITSHFHFFSYGDAMLIL